MRRIFLTVVVGAAMLWAGMVFWSYRQPETELRVKVRTGAFMVWFSGALLMPTTRPQKGTRHKERF
jgi:hypothetical protein